MIAFFNRQNKPHKRNKNWRKMTENNQAQLYAPFERSYDIETKGKKFPTAKLYKVSNGKE